MMRMNDCLQRGDLHIHSIYSDSDADLDTIFKTAKDCGLSCISITDHDNVDGIKEALRLSEIYNIELIEGIELSAQHQAVEVHILGYFIDSNCRKLREALSSVRELRKERLLLMTDKLNDIGLRIDKDELFSKIGNTIPTRLHLGVYLLEKGIVSNLVDAFKKFLSPGKPAYVSRFKYSVREAVQLIKDCGGLAFLAHPHYLPDDSWIEEFTDYGIDGLEVIYPRLSESRISRCEDKADKLGLLKSGGSDAHGSYKEFTDVGSVNIPYQWVEDMKSRLAPRLYTE